MTRFANFAAAAVCLGLATTVSAQDLRFGAGQQGSQNYGVNAALAQELSERAGLDASVQSFGGATAFLPLLGSGDLDIAAVVMPDLGDAVRGKGPFEGLAQDQLRIIAPLLPSPVALMVAKDSGISSIADLKGRKVAWGLPAQASLQPYVEGVLANGGLTGDDVTRVPVTSVGAGVAALIDGKVDATLFALRAGKVVEADAALGGIAWLPLDDDPEAVARMQAVAPEAYVLPVSGDAGIVGIGSDTQVMAYDYVLVARAGLDDETVARIAATLRDNADEIAAKYKVLSALTPEALGRSYDLPHHPAAQAVLGSE
ncbi:TAXI family TRAP transporter solute-binding subunit [Sedimentitalea todarodis]|uniref:TAXI family TRAP transporter solute-binding subunit n=1 Tax=Sedimentitalea todarodis TaxID=1631240 RepID=A0ABU3VM13_9RHOB|nr:TAXI family TRAP transporter solute-binding subunit [Sedimentitalea todarodis]MDU9006704.1 TAXI family TRAP transporter solute-binding subunit [Sedimentitalea todarodis]